MDRLKQRGADLVYRCGKGHTEPLQFDKDLGELVLTQLVQPPRTHRHWYYDVLAPNSLLRGTVTAMAQVPLPVSAAQLVQNSPMLVQPGTAAPTEPPPKPKPRPPRHYLRATLIARIYEVFPLICPNRGGQKRIITFSADIQKILEHIGVELQAPRVTQTRGPPPWDECGAQDMGDGVGAESDWDAMSQSPPDYPDDQRTAW